MTKEQSRSIPNFLGFFYKKYKIGFQFANDTILNTFYMYDLDDDPESITLVFVDKSCGDLGQWWKAADFMNNAGITNEC